MIDSLKSEENAHKRFAVFQFPLDYLSDLRTDVLRTLLLNFDTIAR